MSDPKVEFKLILASEPPPYREVRPWPYDKTAGLIDDNSHCPLFITKACAAFSVFGVLFQVIGFFVEPLPVDSETDLVFFLEDLPGLLNFMQESRPEPYTVSLVEQGIETEFLFRKMDQEGTVEVNCSSHLPREMKSTKELLACDCLAAQLVAFVENYKEGLKRYAPHFLAERWNEKLFASAVRLRLSLPDEGSFGG